MRHLQHEARHRPGSLRRDGARAAFGTNSTALEALVTARLEGTGDEEPQLRFKLGAGAGLNPHFGAPEARVVLGVELFDYRAR